MSLKEPVHKGQPAATSRGTALFPAPLSGYRGRPARLEAVIEQLRRLAAALAILITLLILLSACDSAARDGWQEDFDLDERNLSDTGETEYFILIPGFQSVLASQNETLIVTVLDETREINGISTRVVEEREERNGALIEISRNFFAIDEETGDVFYFGEEVDMYEGGEVVNHSGAWIAYEDGNKPGLIMPGEPEVGMKYYQELAPGVAMDRAEVVSVSETYETPAGVFVDCLRTEESSKLQPAVTEYKTYAPGIGLIQDERLKLVSYGYVEETSAGK